MKPEKQKMLAGELYNPALDPQLKADEIANKAWLARYNAMMDSTADARHVLLSEHFAQVGKGVVVRPPFFCDFGYNITLGDGVFMNFNCVILDIAPVTIGDAAVIGAGSVVTRDVPAGAIAVGNPAKVRG